MADDIRWDLVGDRPIVGRDAVIGLCTESAAHLAGVTTTFRTFRVIEAPDTVVTESTAEYAGADGDLSVVASCDLYRFDGDTLVEITSYTVELPKDAA
jgi:hypothetical protein